MHNMSQYVGTSIFNDALLVTILATTSISNDALLVTRCCKKNIIKYTSADVSDRLFYQGFLTLLQGEHH
jgi:hypothetical protein